jgi:hypothetical protein
MENNNWYYLNTYNKNLIRRFPIEEGIKEVPQTLIIRSKKGGIYTIFFKDFIPKTIINFRNNRPFYFNLKEWKKIEIPDKYNMPEDISEMVNHNLVIQQTRRISFKEAFRLISYFCNEGLCLSDKE